MQQKHKPNYPAGTIGSVMSVDIPAFPPDSSLRDILHRLVSEAWDSIRIIYVVDNNHKLLGIVNLTRLKQQNHDVLMQSLQEQTTDMLDPYDDQEKAVFLAVKDNDAALPVVDKDGKLLGAITARKIISIMHDEHIEDVLLSSGIRHGKRGLQITRLATERTSLIVKSRSPWLLVGLVAGLGLGLISSFFEKSLEETIALAYFIPVVAYIADSVGTQSEAIAVRALATIKIKYWAYLFRELLVGATLGAMVGVLGGLGAFLVSRNSSIALVVSVSLLTASTIAAVVATAIPMIFKAKGKDPALGSGPLSTAIQDLMSVLIYFLFAVLIIR